MRTATALTLLATALCFVACGNGGGAEERGSDAWKAAYADEHISFLNTMESREVDSTVGPLFEFVTKFQVKNTGDREFTGRVKGYFALPGNKGRVPYLQDFTVAPKSETTVEAMFRHTADGVSATCTEMIPR